MLQVAALGADIGEMIVRYSDSDILLKKFNVSMSEGMKTIEIDIAGSKELFIHASRIQENGGLFVPLTTSYYK